MTRSQDPEGSACGGGSMTYMRSGVASQSATPIEPVAPAIPYNFISFLAIAQHLKLDFIPIPWQPALDNAGSGGTSEIAQSIVKLQMSFVFKRIRLSKTTKIEEQQIFQTLVAEITALSHPLINNHPNVVKLLGICWDLSYEGMVLPVLLFEKSPFGTLKEFFTSESGRNMSHDDKLCLCVDIATAIRDLHSCHIIHGDIKPENVIIAKNRNGAYAARVIDFGYSTVYTGRGRIEVPKTPGWNAPEWAQRGGFSFSEAQKVDVFSFGLVCLWLLLYDSSDPLDIHALRRETRNMAAFACERVRLQSDFDDLKREKLIMLFMSTLTSDPEERSSDFDPILKYLITRRTDALNLSVGDLTYNKNSLPTFSIGFSATQFYQSDIRVRKHIAHELEKHMHTVTDKHTAREYAFQLAFCFKVGFGVERSVQFKEHLCNSQRENSDLQNEIELLEQSFTYLYEPIIGQLNEEGNFTLPSLIERSSTQEERTRLLQDYERELRDLGQELPRDHDLMLMLEATLAEELRHLGRWKEAQVMQLKVLESHRKSKGSEHETTLASMAALASTYKDLDQWMQSAEIDVQLMKIYERILGRNHLHTICSMANLASTYARLGKVKDAEGLGKQALEISERTLGLEHAVTLNIMANLASTYTSQERWDEAGELAEQVSETRMRVFGQDTFYTLICRNNLMETYLKRKRFQEAEELAKDIAEIGLEKYGPDHPNTLSFQANYTAVLSTIGRVEEAAQQEVQILEKKKTVYGLDHEVTLISMANLASTYVDLERWEDAGALQKELLQIQEQKFGMDHLNTLESVEDLAAIYAAHGRMEEVQELVVRLEEAQSRMIAPVSDQAS